MTRRWNSEEDNVLRDQVSLYSSCKVPIDWNAVSAALVDRSNKDCRKRWQKIDTRWSSGAWTAAEDQKLHEAVMQSGERWVVVSDLVGTRNPDQCAKRWRNALDPNISHEVWTEEAEKHLANAVESMGRDWKAIAETFFPNRSRQDLSNRYALIQRKNRVRRSYSTSKASNAPSQKQQQGSDDSWQDEQEITFSEDQSLPAASPVPPASISDLDFAAESCLLFGTDSSSLDRPFTNHNEHALDDFAEIFQASQQQQDSISSMHPAPPGSLWPLNEPFARPARSAGQRNNDGRLGNTVITIENLSPATRAEIIELVLHDGGSLRIATT
ncbi:hypothetical protein K458DRAFT_492448 [Lentithecium fluviatile CBS 122367]|uniref:Uncharacterized protein n=1 Tax=Lentithecium fluviatile CBS 122367 TaxID=1168545 RepID=A0A6G1IF12_9PLEO|nr:hypothetical protein K458DRAFT_492448 [Lentithecium fluviatile CBS 122367]